MEATKLDPLAWMGEMEEEFAAENPEAEWTQGYRARQEKMKPIDEAIDRSRSHNEQVAVEADVDDVVKALEARGWETDMAEENNGGMDIWAWSQETEDAHPLDGTVDARLLVFPSTEMLQAILDTEYSEVANIHIDPEGRVTCDVDPMPNTNEAGNIYMGRVQEILRVAKMNDLV